MNYGLEVESQYVRGLIPRIEKSLSGNVVVTAATELKFEPGWIKAAHIVLTPDEALSLAAVLVRFAGSGQSEEVPSDDPYRGVEAWPKTEKK